MPIRTLAYDSVLLATLAYDFVLYATLAYHCLLIHHTYVHVAYSYFYHCNFCPFSSYTYVFDFEMAIVLGHFKLDFFLYFYNDTNFLFLFCRCIN